MDKGSCGQFTASSFLDSSFSLWVSASTFSPLPSSASIYLLPCVSSLLGTSRAKVAPSSSRRPHSTQGLSCTWATGLAHVCGVKTLKVFDPSGATVHPTDWILLVLEEFRKEAGTMRSVDRAFEVLNDHDKKY